MKYPIGIQDFEKIRKEGFVYVDKTAILYHLANEGLYYILSRPRRFGKSLFLSTLRYYFEGRRDLFEGLAVAALEKDWEAFPVLYLDLNARDYVDEHSLQAELNRHLEAWEKTYGDEFRERATEERFLQVIKKVYEQTGKRVVILVDEYDKPLLQTIDNPDVQNRIRRKLKPFYGVLKTMDKYIRFAFLTGVTKFGKVSVFSDLNHLTDLSLLPQFNDLCGISETELHQYFDESVGELAAANGLTKDACYERLRRDFDGYHFYPHAPGIYNPFSLLNTLSYQVFKDYWFETGTPTILVRQLQKTDYRLDNLIVDDVEEDMLNSLDVMNENPLPLMFQSGYLTIKDYDPVFRIYQLGYPNREVEEGFTRFLTTFYLPQQRDSSNFSIRHFVREVTSGNPEGFLRRLSALFADGNYQVVGDEEIYFQNTLYVFFKLLGFYVDVERHTADGRMDVLMQTPDYIYILELKVNQTAAVALQQIEDKGYAAPFAADPRRLFKLGVNFNSARRMIDDWAVA